MRVLQSLDSISYAATKIIGKLENLLLLNGHREVICRLIGTNDDIKQITIELTSQKSNWVLSVTDAHPRQKQLPVVQLMNPKQLLAHVSHDGQICFDNEQGLSIEMERPLDIIAHVLFDAFKTLEDGRTDWDLNNGHDFYNELEGYWQSLPGIRPVMAAVLADSNSRPIDAHVKFEKNKNEFDHLCFLEKNTAHSRKDLDFSKSTCNNSLYLALKVWVQPPVSGEDINETFFTRLVSAFDEPTLKLWRKFVQKKKSGRYYILISFPRPSGGYRSLVGLSLNADTMSDDLASCKINFIKPLQIKRHTDDYIRARGGAALEFKEKHVAIIGCGSVGSEVGETLASIGIGSLSLIDYDSFDIDNIYRHVLGRQFVGLKKSDALSTHLQHKYPEMKCYPYFSDGEAWISENNLNNIDILVVAIGHPASERQIMRQVKLLNQPSTAIVTWLEPLGLGGHSLSFPATGTGCLDCIYRDTDNQPSLYPIISFLKSGQRVTQDLTGTGCSGSFVPYSALHAKKTALLVVDEVVDILKGHSTPNYKYWIGDRSEAMQAGIYTSDWFERAHGHSAKEISQWIFSRPCIRCRIRQSDFNGAADDSIEKHQNVYSQAGSI